MTALKSSILAILFGLVATCNAVADHGDLSGEQVKQLIAGATGTGKTGQGGTFEVRYAADGKVDIAVDNGFSDSGNWSVEGDHYCAQTQKLRNGKKACWIVRHLNGEKYLFKGVDGARNTAATITK